VSVKQFLRMMPQIDRKYLDEAYRVTAGRTTDKTKRGVIVKKVTKIAVAAALCVGVIAGGAALIYKLNKRLAVSPNPHGSGNIGNALETPKFRAVLTDPSPEDSARTRTVVNISGNSANEAFYNYRALAASDTGYYYLGVPQEETDEIPGGARGGICYTDTATGKSMYLCAKPECLHDGSDFCPATTSDYIFHRLLWHDGMLYAVAETVHPTAQKDEWGSTVTECQAVLLKIQPDGTGIEQLAVLDDRGEIFRSEIICHRGALWISGTVYQENYIGTDPVGIDPDRYSNYCGVWHYDLAKSELTTVISEPSNIGTSVGNLQADGDSVYVYKYNEETTAEERRFSSYVFSDPETLRLSEGLLQINAKNGVVTKLPMQVYRAQYTAAGGKLYWVTKQAADPKTGAEESYTLHTLDGETETTVRVPRALHYCTDGNYLIADVNGDTLMVCDMQGNMLRKEVFPGQFGNDGNNLYRIFSFDCADGKLYMTREWYETTDAGIGWERRKYLSAPLEAYANGEAELTEYLNTILSQEQSLT
jgi:hypothetical protein